MGAQYLFRKAERPRRSRRLGALCARILGRIRARKEDARWRASWPFVYFVDPNTATLRRVKSIAEHYEVRLRERATAAFDVFDTSWLTAKIKTETLRRFTIRDQADRVSVFARDEEAAVKLGGKILLGFLSPGDLVGL